MDRRMAMPERDSESTAVPVSTATAEHYTWGDNADGWWLHKSDVLAVIHERMPSGAREPRHGHAAATQIFFVLSGVLTIDAGPRPAVLKSGDAVTILPTMA